MKWRICQMEPPRATTPSGARQAAARMPASGESRAALRMNSGRDAMDSQRMIRTK